MYKSWGIFLFSALVSLGIAELAVRWTFPEYGFPIYTTKMFTEFDPLLGWRNMPNFSGEHIQEEFRVVEKFNSRSLRGPEVRYERTPGVPRILFLGDSFTEGFTVDFPDIFTEVTRRTLEKKIDHPVEVVNAGTSGFSTDQELLFYQNFGRQYKADVTVLEFFLNDLPYNIRADYTILDRGQKPLFELKDGKLTLKRSPEKTWDRDVENEKDLARHRFQKDFAPWIPSSWFLYRLNRHVLRANGFLGSDEDADLNPEPPDDFHNRDAETRKREFIMTEALLAAIRDEVVRDGGRFILMYVPAQREIYDHGDNVQSHPSLLEKRIGEIAARHDIEYLPLTNLMQQKSRVLHENGRLSYYRKNGHWTAEGNVIAGEAIAEKIQSTVEAKASRK